MRTLCLILLFAACLPGFALAETQIHKCKSADGTVVYSQLPCKDEEPAEVASPIDSDVAESPAQLVEKAELLPPNEVQEEPAISENRAACKKRYRDEIDAIDAEIRREYSIENDADYKQQLLALTRKLRAC